MSDSLRTLFNSLAPAVDFCALRLVDETSEQVMVRFDDSLFRVLGDKLIGLTQEREMLIDTDSYGGRSTASARLPGALVKDFMFVL